MPQTTSPIRNYLEWSDEGKSTFWRYMGSLMLILFCWQLPAALFTQFFPTPSDSAIIQLVILTSPFLVGLLAIFVSTKWILKRPWYSVALPGLPPRWGDLGIGLLLQLAIIIVLTVVSLPLTPVGFAGLGNILNIGIFLPFLLLAVIGFLFQTGFEESYFRGFIEQFIRHSITKSIPWIIGLAAVSFASKHISNIAAYGGNWLAMLPYLLFALTMGWVAWRTGSLLLSIGLHWGNNLSLALLIKTAGDVIPSVAPFVRDTPTLPAATLFAIAQAILIVASVEWIVRRRMKSLSKDNSLVDTAQR